MKKSVLIIIISVFLVSTAYAANEKDLWEYWKQANNFNQETIDHSYWDYMLEKYTVEGAKYRKVEYAKITKEDRVILQRYIKYLTQLPIRSYSSQEQMAYWMNLYNAETWLIIIQNYPVETIRKINISPGNFSRGPWGKKVFVIEDQVLSLDDVEHRILRPIWGDDRIHYGVNCASVSCPNVPKVAFTADNLDEMLDEGRASYLDNDRGYYIKGNTVIASSLFKWYLNDFATDEEGLIQYFLKHTTDEKKASQLRAIASNNPKIKFKYDWDLNE